MIPTLNRIVQHSQVVIWLKENDWDCNKVDTWNKNPCVTKSRFHNYLHLEKNIKHLLKECKVWKIMHNSEEVFFLINKIKKINLWWFYA